MTTDTDFQAERVARAICVADGENPDQVLGFMDEEGCYHSDGKLKWKLYIDQAKAAIAECQRWTKFDPNDVATWPDENLDWEVSTKDGYVVTPCSFEGHSSAADVPAFWQYIIETNDVAELEDVIAYRRSPTNLMPLPAEDIVEKAG